MTRPATLLAAALLLVGCVAEDGPTDDGQADHGDDAPIPAGTYRVVVQADQAAGALGLSRLAIGERIPGARASYRGSYRVSGADDLPLRINLRAGDQLELVAEGKQTPVARYAYRIDADGYLVLERSFPARGRPARLERLPTRRMFDHDGDLDDSPLGFLDPSFLAEVMDLTDYARTFEGRRVGDLASITCDHRTARDLAEEGVYHGGRLVFALIVKCDVVLIEATGRRTWSGPAVLARAGTPNAPTTTLSLARLPDATPLAPRAEHVWDVRIERIGQGYGWLMQVGETIIRLRDQPGT